MKPPPPRGLRLWAARLGKGMRIVLRPLTVVNNFVLLSVAYFLGVGLSALWLRLSEKKRAEGSVASGSVASYWLELPVKPMSRERWQRPF